MKISIVIVLLAPAMLSACAGAKPLDYQAPSEIPQGGGLITGKDGEFVILRK